MDRLKNKNTVIIIVSCILVLIAVIVAVSALSGGSGKKPDDTTTTEVTLDLQSLAQGNNTTTAAATAAPAVDEYVTGKYKVDTSGDPLNLRLEPNSGSDCIITLSDGTALDVLAVSGDWGYIVYEKTGGWVSMKYLKADTADSQ